MEKINHSERKRLLEELLHETKVFYFVFGFCLWYNHFTFIHVHNNFEIMALAIIKSSTLITWEVPLQSGDLPEAGQINNWEDNVSCMGSVGLRSTTLSNYK